MRVLILGGNSPHHHDWIRSLSQFLADRAGTSASASPSASAPTSTSRTDGDIVLRGYCSGAGTYLVYRTSRGWTTTTANTDYLRRTC